MSRHLPAPAPRPDAPRAPEVDDRPPPPEHDLPAPDEPSGADLDALWTEDWPDDPPTEPLEFSPLPEVDLSALEAPEDPPDDGLDLDAPPTPELALNLYDEPVVLPWQTTVHLPDRKLRLPATLEPSRPTTTWVGGEAPGPLRLELGGIEVEVEVEVEPGAPGLRIGRDVLSGRIDVRC